MTCAALYMALICLLSVPCVTIAENPQRRVLYISSYSFSWGSVPFQIAGLSEGLGQDYVVNYEFMDTKNTLYSDGYLEFYNLLKYKLSTRKPYDAVVVCDDAALNFVQRYKTELFPNLPIVFSGIDNVQNGIEAASADHETGVVEIVNYAENMALAHALRPKAHTLVLILDNMENGIGIAQQLKESSHAFADYQVEYVNSSDYTEEEFKQKLGSFDDSAIVFCISMGQCKEGRVYSEEERYAMIRDYVHVPMFRFTQSGIGEGLLGGYIVDHEASCRIAGQMLRQMIEEGIEPDINLETPHAYFFDYAVMDAFGIKLSALPKDIRSNCVILNVPDSFLKTHALEIVSILCTIMAVFFVIAIVSHHRRIKELARAVQAANVANEAKSQFLARVSHDMRTPMNAIVNLTQMVESEINDPKAAVTDLHQIQASNKFLMGLINDVLDVSTIEQGKLELHPERYSHKQFTDYMHCTFDGLAKQRGIELTLDTGKKPCEVLVDHVRFNQIGFNLVSNALKYTNPGGHVCFKMRIGEADNGLIPCDILVKDDGIGISKSFQERLFHAFEQEGRSYQTVEGLGLGLTIVKRIVDAMGGTISVQSEENVGSTFTVHLKLKQVEPQRCTDSDAENDPNTLAGKHFLVVEDHPMNQRIMDRLLTKVGVQVEFADNGKIAVDMVAAQDAHFDAILMDLRMPVMDGLTATQEIRRLPSTQAKTVPIIAITANTYSEDIKKCFDVGMDAHIAKPVNPETLYSTLLAHLPCSA